MFLILQGHKNMVGPETIAQGMCTAALQYVAGSEKRGNFVQILNIGLKCLEL